VNPKNESVGKFFQAPKKNGPQNREPFQNAIKAEAYPATDA
jgi:hypothetical protein